MRQDIRNNDNLFKLCLLALIILLSCPISLFGNGVIMAIENKNLDVHLIDQKEDIVLKMGKGIKRKISGKEKHLYYINAETDQFIKVIVNQFESDIKMNFFDPNNNKLVETNNPEINHGSELLYWITTINGSYRIEIESLNNVLSVGEYEIVLKELRSSDISDQKYTEAQKLFIEAEAYRMKTDKDSLLLALVKYKDSLTLWRDIKELEREAITLNLMGVVYHALYNFDMALMMFKEELNIRRAINDTYGEIDVQHNIGAIYSALGKREESIKHLEEVLEIERSINNKFAEVDTLYELTSLYSQIYNIEQVFRHGIIGLELAKNLNLQERQISFLMSLGDGFIYNKNYDLALHKYFQALDLCHLNNNKSEYLPHSVDILLKLALFYRRQGRWQDAFKYYNEALTISKSIKSHKFIPQIFNALTGVGDVYCELGSEQCMQYYNEALKISKEELLIQRLQVDALRSIAIYYSRVSKHNLAINALTEALNKSYKLPKDSSIYVLKILTSLAVNKANNNNLVEALKDSNEALRIFNEKKIENQYFPDLYLIHGYCLYRLGDYSAALPSLNKALEVNKNGIDSITVKHDILFYIASIKFHYGQLEEAKSIVEEIVNFKEQERTTLNDIELRANFLTVSINYFELYIKVLLELDKKYPNDHYEEKAFEISEKTRGRTLIDSITNYNNQPIGNLSPESAEKEKKLKERLYEKSEELIKLIANNGSKEDKKYIESEIYLIKHELKAINFNKNSYFANFDKDTHSNLVSYRQIKQELIDKDTLLIEYFVGQENSFLWVISSTGTSVYTLPGTDILNPLLSTYYRYLLNPILPIAIETKKFRDERIKYQNEFNKIGARLADILLNPIKNKLHAKRLVIIPDGLLLYLPFHSLPVSVPKPTKERIKQRFDRSFLLENTEVLYAPSASVMLTILRNLKNKTLASKSIAIFGDPIFEETDSRINTTQVNIIKNSKTDDKDLASSLLYNEDSLRTGMSIKRLKFVRQEIDRIRELADKDIFLATDFDANIENVMSGRLKDYKIIHFATHGFFNNSYPELSCIALSLYDPDGKKRSGFLTFNQVFELNLSAELVVLSACQTGVGKFLRGEGILGINRGFFYAGASRVMNSLWSVDDESTAELMKIFYKGLLHEGKSPTTSLRDAQLYLSKQTRWKHPFYWAAFQIQGIW